MRKLASNRATIREIDTKYMEQRQQELDRQSKRRKGLFRRLTFMGVVFGIVMIICGITLFNQTSQISEKEAEYERLQAEQAALLEERDDLKQEITNYQDDEFIQDIARRDYFLTFPGEQRINVTKQNSD
ncbi:septum formation initiator family protein [Alkalihalobacillus sp. LMS6]|uniref:FtsB family cell division protein n=1 Tax=Alkalihalobacillus sp. LMS6 TaxID=2924034 RepID=UPI000C078F5C|nr:MULTISPECIES: septum formation initiator family protein [Bacillaceae]UTR06566.1 septum formation initiator family protein [Alkalihalobacillus sp. LMS6]